MMKSPEKIKNMFNEIAPKYDFMNNIISFGLHKFIKKMAVKKLKLPKNSNVVDLCCGTGDISFLLAQKNEVESVIGVDFCPKMLSIANKKNFHKKIKYINADCTKLPFNDKFFDCATMFFGLRNIENDNKAIEEISRILKDGGQFLYMDFSNENKFLNIIFDFFTPLFAKIFSPQSNSSYEYLIKSKNAFYSANVLSQKLKGYNLFLQKEYKFLFSSIFAQIYKINDFKNEK